MPEKVYRGLALLLFGILLCIAEDSLNRVWLHPVAAFPFSLLGILLGAAGLFLVFRKSD